MSICRMPVSRHTNSEMKIPNSEMPMKIRCISVFGKCHFWILGGCEHRSTEHRAQSTEHRAQSTEHGKLQARSTSRPRLRVIDLQVVGREDLRGAVFFL